MPVDDQWIDGLTVGAAYPLTLFGDDPTEVEIESLTRSVTPVGGHTTVRFVVISSKHRSLPGLVCEMDAENFHTFVQLGGPDE
jgi:hypothetical protein